MSNRTTPEIMRGLAELLAAKGSLPGEQALGRVMEIAAHRFDNRHYRGDHLLAALGDLAHAVEPVLDGADLSEMRPQL